MGILDSGFIDTLRIVLYIYLGILWLSLIIWTIRDSLLRSKSFFFQLFSSALVTFFNVLGFLIYLIIRPQQRLSEQEILKMEQQTLAAEAVTVCPKCKIENPGKFVYCTNCGYKVKLLCSGCKKHLLPHWQHCPYCGKKKGARKSVKAVT